MTIWRNIDRDCESVTEIVKGTILFSNDVQKISEMLKASLIGQ